MRRFIANDIPEPNSPDDPSPLAEGTAPETLTGSNAINIVVGHLVTLSMKLPETLVASNFSWTIGGDTVADFTWTNYVVTNLDNTTTNISTGGPVFNYPKTNVNVTFAWWQPATNAVVKAQCVVNGVQLSASCSFLVKKPTTTVLLNGTNYGVTTTGEIYLSKADFGDGTSDFRGISLGLDQATNRGVYFRYEKPNYGQASWLHLLSSSVRTLTYETTTQTETESGLDGDFPVDNAIIYDSPRHPLNNAAKHGAVTESFKDYLMWYPGDPGVWVPLISVGWNWNAAATNSTPGSDGWLLVTNPVPVKPSPGITNTPGYPSWNRKVRQ